MSSNQAVTIATDSTLNPSGLRSDQVISSDLLEAEICELAARISIATARLIILVGEFDRLEHWAGLGIKSCAHWLSWRCHIDLHTAREQVRVARALRSLPLITAEFCAGELSYTKVRALTRIATADCEADLVELAKAATAPQVERTVAGWRRADSQARDDVAKQQLSWHFADDGMLVVRARLSPEDGAQFLTALQAAQARLERSSEGSAESANEPAPTDSPTDRSEIEIPPAAAPRPRATEPATPPVSQIDALVSLTGAYLTGSMDGRDPNTDLVVTIDAAALQQSAAAGLALYQTGGALTADQVRRLACDTKLVVVLKDGADVLDVGRSTRTVSRALRRALWARDGGCAVPGCGEHRQLRLHAHHIIHWADGGPTCLDNLVLTCKTHHREIHENGLSVCRVGDRIVFGSLKHQTLEPNPPQPAVTEPEVGKPLADFAAEAMSGHRAQANDGQRLQLEWVLATLQGRRESRRARRADAEQQPGENSRRRVAEAA